MIWYKKSIVWSVAGLILLLPFFVGAEPPVADPCKGGLCNPLGSTTDLSALILKIVEGIAQIGYYLVVLFIIYSGFKFVTARGDVKKLGEAKQMFLYTVIGAAILLGATLLAKVIQGTVDELGKDRRSSAEYVVIPHHNV